MVVRPCSYQERALPAELCGQVAEKAYGFNGKAQVGGSYVLFLPRK